MHRTLRARLLSSAWLSLGVTVYGGCADSSPPQAAPQATVSLRGSHLTEPAARLTPPAALRLPADVQPQRLVLPSSGFAVEPAAGVALQPSGTISGLSLPSNAGGSAIAEPQPATEVARLPDLPSDAPSLGPTLSPPSQPEAPQSRRSDYYPSAVVETTSPPPALPLYVPAEIPLEPQPAPPPVSSPAAPAVVPSLAAPQGDRTWRLEDTAAALPPQLQPQAQPSPVTQQARGADNHAALRAVAMRADELVRHARSLGQRGAYFSARAELVQALRLVAQALDAQAGGKTHSEALARGLEALREADDFAPRGTRLESQLDVAQIVLTHRTPVLKNEPAATVSPLAALQRYYTYAQGQLATAGGELAISSQALYTLGKVQLALADSTSEAQRLQSPKAMTFYQAAMLVDGGNYLAANELGVMLARYGQLHDARRLLLHSVAAQPHVAGWQNLAAVHAQLGEADLAQKAEYERQLLAAKLGPAASAGPVGSVQWLDAAAFARTSGPDQAAPATATRPVEQVQR